MKYNVLCNKEQNMKPMTLFKILQKRLLAQHPELLLSKTRDGSLSRQWHGRYYLHDLKNNEVVRKNINLLDFAKELRVECIDTVEGGAYA